jgi:diguanylate cyclase (GGDEF)-like protein/putative nucleotidyltransferase with HDIG domain
MVTPDNILHARILIVDDLEANVLLLEQMLRDAGYVCITSTRDPRAVCALHSENHYDLILLDLRMPGMDGFQVMAGLKEIERDGYLPVLAVTAEPAHKVRALQSGAKDFVSKPLDLAEVLMRVRNLLEVRLLHEAAKDYGKMLESLALNDPLTGLANRRLLTDRMAMALVHAHREKSSLAVLFLDLDGFKGINDTLGHGVGDILLKMVAERLVATVREEDTVARFGGDEFILALWYVSGTDYAAMVALRAIEAVSQPYDIQGISVTITTSVGISVYPDHGEDSETLMKSADLALYEAKRSGKNTYRLAAGRNSFLALSEITCLDKRIKRNLEQLTALVEIDRAINFSFDLKLSLTTLLTHVLGLLRVDAAAVLMFNPATRMLEYVTGQGFRSETRDHAPQPLGEGYAGLVAQERRIVHIPDLTTEHDSFLRGRVTESEGFVSYHGVPLLAKGEIVGVLELFHRSRVVRDDEWQEFLTALASQAAIAINNVSLFDNLQRSNAELFQAYDATIEGWSRSLELRDKETEGHTQRVALLSVTLARLFGLSEAELVQVRWGALLHDIGKMGVPDRILHKKGALTPAEWVIMKQHPVFAGEMLSPIRYLRLALEIPLAHHEKWDGTGYPHGLKGEEIPLVARIFAVADVWDALRSDRRYHASWSSEKVREQIRSLAGTHFDPEVVTICLDSNSLQETAEK